MATACAKVFTIFSSAGSSNGARKGQGQTMVLDQMKQPQTTAIRRKLGKTISPERKRTNKTKPDSRD